MLLKKSTGKKRATLEGKIDEIVNKDGMDRIVGLLSLLNYMANQCNYEPITSLGYSPRVDVVDFSRFNIITVPDQLVSEA